MKKEKNIFTDKSQDFFVKWANNTPNFSKADKSLKNFLIFSFLYIFIICFGFYLIVIFSSFTVSSKYSTVFEYLTLASGILAFFIVILYGYIINKKTKQKAITHIELKELFSKTKNLSEIYNNTKELYKIQGFITVTQAQSINEKITPELEKQAKDEIEKMR